MGHRRDPVGADCPIGEPFPGEDLVHGVLVHVDERVDAVAGQEGDRPCQLLHVRVEDLGVELLGSCGSWLARGADGRIVHGRGPRLEALPEDPQANHIEPVVRHGTHLGVGQHVDAGTTGHDLVGRQLVHQVDAVQQDHSPFGVAKERSPWDADRTHRALSGRLRRRRSHRRGCCPEGAEHYQQRRPDRRRHEPPVSQCALPPASRGAAAYRGGR